MEDIKPAKPKVVIFGDHCSGKSTLINYLLTSITSHESIIEFSPVCDDCNRRATSFALDSQHMSKPVGCTNQIHSYSSLLSTLPFDIVDTPPLSTLSNNNILELLLGASDSADNSLSRSHYDFQNKLFKFFQLPEEIRFKREANAVIFVINSSSLQLNITHLLGFNDLVKSAGLLFFLHLRSLSFNSFFS